MSRGAFIFTAQFALDRARQTQEACERALLAATRSAEQAKRALTEFNLRQEDLQSAVAAARSRLARLGYQNVTTHLSRTLSATTQPPIPKLQSGSEPDSPSPIWGDDRAAAREEVESVRRACDRHRATVAAKAQHAAYAAKRLTEERRALESAMGLVKTLEAMRQARLRDHQMRRLRANEREADDIAVEAWRRGQL